MTTPLPDGWESERLGNLCKQRSEAIEPSDNPSMAYVGLEHIDPGQNRLDRYGTASDVTSSKSKFYKSDILYGKLRPYLDKAILAEREGFCSTDILVVVPDVRVLTPEFLVNLIHTKDFVKFAVASTRGVNHPRTSWSSLASFELLLPPLSEQRAIAHALRAIQYAKTARQHEVALEREHKAALMQRLFTSGTRNEPRKQTEIGEIPESWQVVKLGSLCSEGLGFIQTGPFGSQLHASDYKEIGIPVVNPTHMGFNVIVDEGIPVISREDADRLSKHYLLEGDILVSRRGDFRHYSYVTSKQAGWLCGTGCLLIRLENPLVDNYFVSVSVGEELVQTYLQQNAVGLIMPNINTKILEGIPLVLPPVWEQRRIASTLRACDTKIATLDREVELLDELFRALLDKLMTGEIRATALINTPEEAHV